MTHREKHKGATQGMMSEENEEQRDVEIHRSKEELDGRCGGRLEDPFLHPTSERLW